MKIASKTKTTSKKEENLQKWRQSQKLKPHKKGWLPENWSWPQDDDPENEEQSKNHDTPKYEDDQITDTTPKIKMAQKMKTTVG